MKRTNTRSVSRLEVSPINERRCRSKLHDSSTQIEIWGERFSTLRKKYGFEDDDTTNQKPTRICHIDSKYFKRSRINWLIEKNFLTQRNSFVCDRCVQYAEDQFAKAAGTSNISEKCELTDGQSPTRVGCSDNISDSELKDNKLSDNFDAIALFDRVTDLVLSGEYNESEMLTKLCGAIGKSLSRTVYKDSQRIHSYQTDLPNLTKLDCKDYLDKRPPALISFLKELTSICSSDRNSTRLLPLCIGIEQLYKTRNKLFIGPFSFSNGIIKYSLTGSKTANTLDGASTASGSVTTIKQFLKSSASDPNTCFDKDVDIFSDNTQRTGKTARVRENGTTPLGVATNVVFIQQTPPSDIQSRDDLKPGCWPQKSKKDIASSVKDFENQLNTEYFRPFRQEFQLNKMKQIAADIKFTSDGVIDTIAKVRVIDSTQRVCNKCGHVYSKVIHSCPEKNCNNNPNNVPDRSILYGSIPHGHPSTKPNISMGEIIGVNPNSRENLKKVVKGISNQVSLANERKWVRLGFDGVPYRIVQSIIENLVICESCGAEIDLKNGQFETHAKDKHGSYDSVTSRVLYENILLVPGAGHIEKNLLIIVFRLCRSIFLEYLTDCLGFKSKRAKEFAIGCSNHHIAWQILCIALEAIASELIFQYIIYCKGSKRNPSVDDFVKWRNDEVKNSNYILMYDITFSVLLGLKCYRTGIRRNNSNYALAGRQKIAPLVYTGKHPIYQELLMNDMKIRVTAPEEVRNYIQRNESFSKSSDTSSGEGGDYVTEAENRNLKTHLPPGVPTLESWIQASRCDKHLKKLRAKVFESAEIKDPGLEKTLAFNFDDEIQMFRSRIRISGWLDKPMTERSLISITGDALHPDLVNFYFTSREAYDNFKTGKDCQDQQIFITLDDESKFNNVKTWTVKRITSEIHKLIELFDNDTSESYKSFFETEVSRGKKRRFYLLLS